MPDVSFGEDSSRRRKNNHAINFNIVAKTALTLLTHSSQKIPISHKKHNTILNNEHREEILGFKMRLTCIAKLLADRTVTYCETWKADMLIENWNYLLVEFKNLYTFL